MSKEIINDDTLKKYDSCKTCPNRVDKKLCTCGCKFNFCKYAVEE